jgi:hypothetical protein
MFCPRYIKDFMSYKLFFLQEATWVGLLFIENWEVPYGEWGKSERKKAVERENEKK